MTYLLIGIAMFGALYFVASVVLPHMLRRRRFNQRPSVPFDDIYAERFAASGVSKEVAERIWVESARQLRVDASKLRPSDRFDSELSHRDKIFPFVDLNDDFYWWTVNSARRLRMENKVIEQLATLGDYVAEFSSRESASGKHA